MDVCAIPPFREKAAEGWGTRWIGGWTVEVCAIPPFREKAAEGWGTRYPAKKE